MALPEKWSQLLTDYAYIKTESDQTKSNYPIFLNNAKQVIAKCYGVLSDLENGAYDANGGDPFTKIIDSSTDCNGGYPS